MQSAVETLSPTRVRLTVEVPFAELKPELDSAYKKIGQQVRVQGFRPGKVPPRILDQRVGRGAVLEEAVNEAVPRLYGEAVEQTGVTPVAPPQVDVTKLDDGVELAFTAEVDVRPEITLPAYDGLAVTVDAVEVTDDEVDEQVEALRERFGQLVPVERAAEPTATSSPSTSPRRSTATRCPGGTAAGPDLRARHRRAARRHRRGRSPARPPATPAPSRPTLVAGEHAGQTAEVAVTVRAVNERELPEVDDQWASDTTGFATAEEFRDDVRTRLDRAKRMQQGVEARDKVLEALLAAGRGAAARVGRRTELDWRRRSTQRAARRRAA